MLSAIACELVPIVVDSENEFWNVVGISVGFVVGVALFLVAEEACGDDDDEDDEGEGKGEEKGKEKGSEPSPAQLCAACATPLVRANGVLQPTSQTHRTASRPRSRTASRPRSRSEAYRRAHEAAEKADRRGAREDGTAEESPLAKKRPPPSVPEEGQSGEGHGTDADGDEGDDGSDGPPPFPFVFL